MKNKISYETLTERLKCTPTLEQPEKLTQAVIEKIEQIKANRLKIKAMYITGWSSAAAAVLLLGMLILETLQTPATYATKTEQAATVPASVTSNAYRELMTNAKDKSITEKRNIINAIIKDKWGKNIRKEQLYKLVQIK
jgi:hypothetical protein